MSQAIAAPAAVSSRFDLSGLAPFESTGFWSEAPAYLPSPEETAWALGYELEAMGEHAKLPRLSGYSTSEYQAFCNGQAAAKREMRPEPAPVPFTSEMLADALRATADHCQAQGGPLGAFLSAFLRDGAAEVGYLRANDWESFEGRRQAMLDTLQDCPTCSGRRYEDVVL